MKRILPILLFITVLIISSCSESKATLQPTEEILSKYQDYDYKIHQYKNMYLLIEYSTGENEFIKTYYHLYNRQNGDFDEIIIPGDSKLLQFSDMNVRIIVYSEYGGSGFQPIPYIRSYWRSEDINSNKDFTDYKIFEKMFTTDEKLEMLGKKGELIDICISNTSVEFTYGPYNNDMATFTAADFYYPTGTIEYDKISETLIYQFEGSVSQNLLSNLSNIVKSPHQPITDINIEVIDDKKVRVYLSMTNEVPGFEKNQIKKQDIIYYARNKVSFAYVYPVLELEWVVK